jgi:predicted molibdopterin-dependent oxidoreductase YjgC
VQSVETICPYCGCGCTVLYDINRNEVIRAGSRPGTINEGWLCVKGRFGFPFINSPDRLKAPLLRKNGSLAEVTWDEAMEYVSSRLRNIRDRHGPDAVAGLSSARCTNEENYLFQKVMRAAVGTNNIDHCARY